MADDAQIVEAALALAHAARGKKRAVAKAIADDLGMSVATLYRHVADVGALPPRRKRADAGSGGLQPEEAEKIWGLVGETTRLTGTGALAVMDAVRILRANGEIRAERVDKKTGAAVPLSESTICRGLRDLGYTAAEMTADSPATRMSSPHPNWCWQIDASVSRQFYLADEGTRAMPKREFYRGKPKNFENIASRRIWRYVVTDHCSGCIEVFYVQGAESGANVIATLIHAMTNRSGGTMHGIPQIVMSDPGSGMVAAPVKNFLAALGVRFIANQVGNARAKGQVENAQYIVERSFEAALKLQAPVTSIEEINSLAQVWAYGYNATSVHTRTKKTRRDAWLQITPEQLVFAPSIDVLQQLPNSTPKQVTVRDCMIRFGGLCDVRGIPELVNGMKVMVVRNALDDDCVRVILEPEREGGPVRHYLAPRIGRDDNGFLAGSAQIGTRFAGVPQGPAEARKKAIERLLMDVQTDEEAAAARKAKRLPFGGRIDPMKHLREADVMPALPRAGVVSTVQAPDVLAAKRIEPAAPRRTFPDVSHDECAMRIKRLLELGGHAWHPSMFARIAQRWPDGVPYDQVDALALELTPAPAARLRVIDGGAA
ncbi:MAG: integrase [Gammaproteobacteria bacterium HGW-Gammaproteobacteria-8]|jgi:transposase InsO family protein|nr:MAG: integrase [Gammaproteobacteria bacterium HGW-Gammaproteobacteria-8]